MVFRGFYLICNFLSKVSRLMEAACFGIPAVFGMQWKTLYLGQVTRAASFKGETKK